MRMPAVVQTAGEHINPIVVKELRQAVRSRYVIGVLILFLLVSVGVLTFALLEYDGYKTRMGANTFMVLEGILFATCLLFVPAYTGIRLSSERWQANIDLFFSTTLGTRKIVTGKFHASLLIMLLLYSACLPFMMLSYMLRGIDIPTILALLTFHFLIAATVLQGVIFVACIPCSRFFKAMLGLAIGLGLLSIFGIVMGISEDLIGRGVTNALARGDFWQAAGVTLAVLGIAYGFGHVFSVSLLSPPHANRTVWIRVYTTVVWLLTGAACLLMQIHGGMPWEYALVFWASVSLAGAAVLFFLAVSERDVYSLRIRRNIPRKPSLRIVALPFYSGAAGGVFWALIIGLIALIVLPSAAARTSTGMDWEDMARLPALFLYAFAYSHTGLLLRRLVLKKHVKPGATWLLGAILLTITIALSGIGYGLLQNAGVVTVSFDRSYLQLLNPFMVLAGDEWVTVHLVFALIWALMCAAIHVPWYHRQIREYRPLELDTNPDRYPIPTSGPDGDCAK